MMTDAPLCHWRCGCGPHANGTHRDFDKCLEAAWRHWKERHVAIGETNTRKTMIAVGPEIWDGQTSDYIPVAALSSADSFRFEVV